MVLAWVQRQLLLPSHLVPRPRHAGHLAARAKQRWIAQTLREAFSASR
jgi:hypothetical protein